VTSRIHEQVRIEPFVAAVPAAELDGMRARIAATRWPEWPDVEPWSEGPDPAYLRDLAAYWAEGFDWRVEEARLNRFRQFRAHLDGLGVHFIHERGEGPAPFPIVLTHGWPGSVLEMLELIPRLTHPSRFGGDPADAFDVVVPSLPGYGFSERPSSAGMSPARIARLWARLMRALGYERFGAQGGDWGSSVATWLALLMPEHVAGIQLNYLPGSYRPAVGPDAPLTADEAAFLRVCADWLDREGAYAHLHRTAPLTAAYGLYDSPVGLAAWIVEKLRSWSDCGGELERRFSRDEVLATVSLYWLTGTIGSSMRLYREGAAHPLALAADQRVGVPAGFALFPAETPGNPPRAWVERGYDVTRWQSMPRGGHFGAWEEPVLLAGEIQAFFREVR
jgi:pimeloyl-ACP methyl ester carboxylesterase